MGFFENIANKFTEKPGRKITYCKECNHLCGGYPVEKWSKPLINKTIRLAGATIGGVFGFNGGGTIAEPVANRLFDSRLKNGRMIVYAFKCDDCGREFFRMMPDDDVFYSPTKEQEEKNNQESIELLREALKQKYEY